MAKLELLIAVCEGDLAKRGSELSILLQRIAARRNDLVHPKAHAYDLGDTAHTERGDWPDHLPARVGSAIDDMESFFERFAAISDDSRAAVEYFDDAFADQIR